MPTRVTLHAAKIARGSVMVQIVDTENANAPIEASPTILPAGGEHEFYVGDGKALLVTEHRAPSADPARKRR